MSLKSSSKNLSRCLKEPLKMVLQGIISGSPKYLSNYSSLKNHVLKEFFDEPIKVSQRTLKKDSLRHYFLFHKEPDIVLQRT